MVITMEILALLIAILFFAAGLIGTLLPVLPGALLLWVGMLIYGIMTGFQTLGTIFFIGQGMAVALVHTVDYLAGVVGVKKFGGSKNAVYGSIVGAILGIFVMGPAGIIFGPFIGAVIGEMMGPQKQLDIAIRSGVGTLVGMLGGTVLKLAVEAIMIIWFFWAVY